MQLRFTGCGSAYYPELGSTGAYFFVGSSLVMLDCGESTFAAMKRLGVFDKCGEVYVIVTHFHTDHIGSLPSLASYLKNVLDIRVHIYFPSVLLDYLLKMLGLEKDDYISECGKAVLALGDFCAQPVAVQHADSILCYGYILSDKACTVFYSGDAYEVPHEIIDMLKKRKLNAVYQDVTYENGGNTSHGSLERLCAQIPPPLRSRVFAMHLGSDFKEKIKQNGFGVVAT